MNQQNEAANSEINSIITTIAVDETESSKSCLYNLDIKPTLPLLTHSKSQNDLQFESLQSQTPIEEDKKFKVDYNNPPASSNQLNQTKASAAHQDADLATQIHKDIDNIQALQSQLLNNFLYYLQNYQMITSLENRFAQTLKKKNSASVSKKPLPEFHSHQCQCFKDMLNSFLMLIDYQFNENFYFGATLSFDECFRSKISSECLFFPSTVMEHSGQSFVNPVNVKTEPKEVNQQQNSLLELKTIGNDLNSEKSRFMFLSIMKCSFTLNSLFKNKQLEPHKLAFYDSIRDDYRLKNFYCLYSFAEVVYDDFVKANTANAAESADDDIKGQCNHLQTTLNWLKKNFKIDEYFQLE